MRNKIKSTIVFLLLILLLLLISTEVIKFSLVTMAIGATLSVAGIFFIILPEKNK